MATAQQGAAGTAVILSANPIHDTGGGQRSAQLALELLKRGWTVVFVSHGVVTETVDLGLRYEQPRLVQRTMAEALEPDERRVLLETLTKGRGLLVTQVPVADWMPWLREAGEQGVPTVYDCIDRWASELGRGWYRRRAERDIAEASHTLVASAPALVDHVEELTGREVALLPNAYNGHVFDSGLSHRLDRPASFPDDGRVALYVGALWGGWMDWSLVRTAAEALPETTFVFVGDHRGEGGGLPDNCVFVGLLPQTDLPAYLAHADLAFVPWRVDEVTVATSPLKVYEFVALALPVVAPPIDPLRDIPGVWTEASPDAFVRALGTVERSGLGDDALGAMRAFAAENSWSRRVDDLLRLVESPRPEPTTVRSRPCISVVVPAYDHERFVGRALESVEIQSLAPGEVVVVDDGSPDRTAEVVESRSLEGLRLVRQENRGAHHALNRAIRLTRGDWIAVLNSDDAWEPERLEHVWAVTRESGAALVVGSVRLVDAMDGEVDGSHEIARWYREARTWAAEAGSLRAVLGRHNIGVTTSNFFFHRALWSRLGGFRDYRYVHDYDFILRAVELCPDRVVYAPELGGVLYRVHAANTITDGGAAQRERRALMSSLRRPARRLRRAFSGVWDRRAVAEAVESSAILEPVPATLTNSLGEDGVRLPGSAPGGRVRVGLVVDSMGLGGLEEVVALLAQSLPQAGVDTAVACVRKGGVVARRLADAGVDVTVLGGDAGRVGVWAEEKGVAVANSHFAPVDAVEALADAGIPVVETVQNCYAWLDDDGWAAERRRAGSVSGMVAVSDTVAAYHARRCGREVDWIVPNAVHPARAAAAPRAFARRVLGLPEDRPVLAFVGRLTEQKNPAGLVDAFAEAVGRIAEASLAAPVLVMAGPADDSAGLPALRRRHAALFGDGTVRHFSDVRHVGTVLAATDVYVSNAFYEGWSVAASEAAWVGCPLAMSETGGSRALVGAVGDGAAADGVAFRGRGSLGERGIVVPNPWGDPLTVDARGIAGVDGETRRLNVEALAEAMVVLVNDADGWRSRRGAIQAWARQEVAPGVIARRYAAILAEVAGRGED